MSARDSIITASVLIPCLLIANIAAFYYEKLTVKILTLELFASLITIFVYLIITYKSMYTGESDSVKTLLSLRNISLGESNDTLSPNIASVCKKLVEKTAPYTSDLVPDNKITLVNWAPLTVRLAGYLGGDTSVTNGVFDMANGIKYALNLGARSFVFDIDYLDTAPCKPLVIHRDAAGVQRSLNTGSISQGMCALNDKAFLQNYDPVIIVLYLRRIPPGLKQQNSFFRTIASAMNSISTHHLGLTEAGSFHSCTSESTLFTSNITDYQKKFIVLCNYNTSIIPRKKNPKENLHFWVNARLWKHESSTTSIGSVTPAIATGTMPYAKVCSTSDVLTLPSAAVAAFQTSTRTVYTVAIGSVEEILTMAQMNTLITRGIHSIPMDVIRLGETEQHTATITAKKTVITLTDITSNSSTQDPLSYWTYAGYYRFNHAS